MKIAIYARKSKISDKGESIQSQIDMCKAYIALHYPESSNHIEIYADNGFSGGSINRPDFMRFINDCKQGKIEKLICYRLDRVSRSIADFSNTYAILEAHGIEFISIKENFDTSTPIGRAMLNIALVFAQLERETIQERIRDNLLSLAHDGKWLGGTTPLGYASQKVTYIGSHNKEKHCYELIVRADECYTIKTIFNKYVELGTLSKLETYLIQENIKTRHNKTFRATTLRQILMNPTYCPTSIEAYEYFEKLGCKLTFTKADCNDSFCFLPFNRCKNGKSNQMNDFSTWIIAQGSHKPIISSSLWLLVQQILKSNVARHFQSHQGNIGQVALLGGLIHCKCGAKMKVTNHTILADGSISYIYKCTDKLRSRGTLCDAKNIKGHYLDKIILDQIALLPSSQLLLQKLLMHGHEVLKDELTQSPLLSIEAEIEANTNKIDTLIEHLAVTPDKSVREVLLNKVKELQLTNIHLKVKIDAIKADIPEAVDTSEHVLPFVADLLDFKKAFQQSTFMQKKRLINSIISSINFTGDEIIVKTSTNPLTSPSYENSCKITNEKR